MLLQTLREIEELNNKNKEMEQHIKKLLEEIKATFNKLYLYEIDVVATREPFLIRRNNENIREYYVVLIGKSIGVRVITKYYTDDGEKEEERDLIEIDKVDFEVLRQMLETNAIQELLLEVKRCFERNARNKQEILEKLKKLHSEIVSD